jgi:DNA primase
MRFRILSDNIDVLKLLEILKIEGKVNGDNFVAHCPVNPDHEDKSPSWGIKIGGEGKGVWNCYGCGMKGNAVHLVMVIKGVTRDDAERLICEWFDIQDITPDISSAELLKMLDEPKSIEDEEVLVIPLPRLSGNKEKVLKYLMEVRRYTEKEGWDIINAYQMDFCDKGYYKDRIITPIYDSSGVYVSFEAQAIDKVEKKKLYPKGTSTGRLLFNDHNVKSKKVCIVEGIWDVLRLRSYGISAIGMFGSNISKYQAYYIIRKYDEVTLFFDGDKAGQEAVVKAKEILFPYVTVGYISVEGKDPDEVIQDDIKGVRIFDEEKKNLTKEN